MDEPPVVIYVQHSEPPVVDRLDSSGEWRAEAEWPPPGCEQRALYLTENGVLAEGPGADGADAFEYDPTVGVCGGLWSGGLEFGLPGDQRSRRGVLARLHIAVARRAVDGCRAGAGIPARLLDRPGDKLCGQPLRRLSRREFSPHRQGDAERDAAAVADRPGTAHRGRGGRTRHPDRRDRLAFRPRPPYPRGHRERRLPERVPTPEPGRNEVHRGASTPSRLVLPVVPLQGSATPPSFAPSPKKVTPLSAGIQPPRWDVTRDVLTGRTHVTIDLTKTNRVNSSTVVRQEFLMVNEVDPRDPAHANSRGRFLARVERPGQRIEARSDIAIQGTRSAFQVVIDLDVRLNEARHVARRWTESVPRQLL